MLLRLEVFGHVLHLEVNKAQPPAPEPDKPVDVPTPMVVYPEEPRDPLGFQGPRR